MSSTLMYRIGLLVGLATASGLAACSSLLGVDSDGAMLSGDGGNCQAKSCKDFGPNACGKHDDSCSKILDCGVCCVPKTCADLGAQCGPIDNGCGGLVQCGTCTVAKTQCVQTTRTTDAGAPSDAAADAPTDAKAADSAGGSTPSSPSADTAGPTTGASYCACIPDSTCAAVECGEVADGCGRRYVCNNAPCPGDKPNCTAGKCTATGCVPKTCVGLGKNCDDLQDGCGKILNCGACIKPARCGGGGVANVCGCTPKSMAAACGTRICGNVDDGCGTPIDCGVCDGVCNAQGQICADGAAEP